MQSLLVSIFILVIGYIFYGRFVEKVVGMNPDAKTPALTKTDGVDFVPMKKWRVFLIQFLNIAGLGPIFGAILGVMYGPSSYLWIVLGSIFAGGVHDYLNGMMSVKMEGLSLPDIIGHELGKGMRTFMLIVSVVLLLLLTTSFMSGVATLLQSILPLPEISVGPTNEPMSWILVVFFYFIIATMLPVDKVIGKLYPIFGIVLIATAIAIVVVMLNSHASDMPSLADGLANRHSGNMPIFPMMFVSIACGAISGFHGTQSPLMSRCITNERQGRFTFYGAMICEGILALIWAAAAGTVFADPENGVDGIAGLQAFADAHPGENIAALVVDKLCSTWFGVVGSIIAIVGVVLAPLTSGDTALRSARLIMADFLNVDQKQIGHRFMICIPLGLIVLSLNFINFDSIWRYFSFTNQMLATISLWAGTVYLYNRERNTSGLKLEYRYGFLIAMIPAAFMTMVVSSYLMVAPEGFKCAENGISGVGYAVGAFVTISVVLAFIRLCSHPTSHH